MDKVKQEIYYKSILDSLTAGLITLNTTGEIIYINYMASKILRLDENSCIGFNYEEVFVNFDEFKEIIKRMLITHKTIRRGEFKIMHADVPFKIGYGTMLVKKDDKIIGYSIIFQDISFVN